MIDANSGSERRRQLAEKLECMIEEDWQLLTGYTDKTIEAMRKRGQGPAYVRLGKKYLYPIKSALEYVESLTKQRVQSVGGLL
jgi:hypothetical protein